MAGLTTSELAIAMSIRGARQTQSELRATQRELAKMPTPLANIAKYSGLSSSGLSRMNKVGGFLHRTLFGLGGQMLALGAGFAAIAGIRGAISSTEAFTKSVIQLHAVTGMTVADTSRWVATLQARGVSVDALGRSWTILAKSQQAALSGSKTALAAYAKLGINVNTLRGMSPEQLFLTTVDRLKSIRDHTERLALAQQLYGRGWQQLAPLIGLGSKGIEEQLRLADKYGITLHGKTLRSLRDLEEAQRENQMAVLGLNLALGQALIPTITKGIKWVNGFINEMRTGKGTGGEFANALKGVGRVLLDLVKPLLSHKKLLGAVLAAMVVVVPVAYALGAALAFVSLVSGIGLLEGIVLGVIAVGTALVVCYERFTTFRNIVNAVIGFVRRHWLLFVAVIAGPLVAALIMVVKHFGAIKAIVMGVYHAVTKVINAMKAIPHAVGGFVHKVGSVVHSGGHWNPLNDIPHFATGGTVSVTGASLVGERGPEVVTLPRGAHVSSNRDIVDAINSLAVAVMGQPLVVEMDGRAVTKGVARVVADNRARA